MDEFVGKVFADSKIKDLITSDFLRLNEARQYKAFDECLARWVVVKLTPFRCEDQAVKDIILSRIASSAQTIAALRHCNITMFCGYGSGKEWVYTKMEYIPQGSLQHQLDTNVIFTWQQSLDIVIPIAQALTFAHRKEITHTNVEPTKILLPQDNWPLLVFDVEVGSIISECIQETLLENKTRQDLVYAAPEKIQKLPLDFRADIYSLGIILYRLLSGSLPFEAEASVDLFMARLLQAPPLLTQVEPEIATAFTPILDKALAPNPEHRYQSMVDFCQDLIKIRHQLERLTSQEPTAGPTSALTTQEAKEPKVVLRLMANGQQISAGDQEILVVGRTYRSSKPDIDLGPYGGTKAGVSRRHGRLMREDNQWYVEDLNSTNGTFVNGDKITTHTKVLVLKGDRLRFGQIELKFEVA